MYECDKCEFMFTDEQMNAIPIPDDDELGPDKPVKCPECPDSSNAGDLEYMGSDEDDDDEEDTDE